MLGRRLLTAAEFAWDEWRTYRRETKPSDDNGAGQIPLDFFPPSNTTGSRAQAPAVHATAVAGWSQPRTLGNDLRGGLTQGLVKASDLRGERPPDSLAYVEQHNLTRAARANTH